MKYLTLFQFFNEVERRSASLDDSQHDTIKRDRMNTKDISEHVFMKDEESPDVYFWIPETSITGVQGYTIICYNRPGAYGMPCSAPGQFFSSAKADEAVEAFVKGRITQNMCFDAYNAKKSDCVSDVVLFKRNLSRSGSIQDYRKAERLRTIPGKQDKRVPFLKTWLTDEKNLSRYELTQLLEFLQSKIEP